MTRLVLIAALAATALLPAGADAKVKRGFWQVDAGVAWRVWDHIGFTPINGIQKEGGVTRYAAGSTTYVVSWQNALASTGTTSGLRLRNSMPSKTMFTDRPLRKKEKRKGWRVAWDMARDADVLLVHPGNPVCASGLTKAQARGIAKGEITSWSAVGGSGAIRRYLVGDPANNKRNTFAEPRFGAKGAGHPVSAVRFDGGVSEAASDPSAAAITSWSRVRHGSGACAVAIDGVKPTNASVHSRQYGPAYPVQFVWNKRRPKHKEYRVMYREYVRFLKSEKAREDWRGRGLLLVEEGVPADPATGPSGPSGPDPEPQPGSEEPVRDDAGVEAELVGERFAAGDTVLAFDANGVFNRLTGHGTESCSATTAGWTVAEGYRYSEDGGGMTAIVDIDVGPVQIVLPNAEPGVAYVDGVAHTRDASLVSTCT